MTVLPDLDGHTSTLDLAGFEDAVVELRLRGCSLGQIAGEIGQSRATIRTILKRVEERSLGESALRSIRISELRRLDTVLERIWPLLDPADPDAGPDLVAVDVFLAISKRRSALVGMDVRPAQTLNNDARRGMPGVKEERRRADSLRRMLELTEKLRGA